CITKNSSRPLAVQFAFKSHFFIKVLRPQSLSHTCQRILNLVL
ncbi:hypothetical protein, partial [uncultured Gammaproteobacteria bacterium]